VAIPKSDGRESLERILGRGEDVEGIRTVSGNAEFDGKRRECGAIATGVD